MIRNYDEGDADVRGMIDRRKGGKLSSVCTGWIISADAAEPAIRHLRERKNVAKSGLHVVDGRECKFRHTSCGPCHRERLTDITSLRRDENLPQGSWFWVLVIACAWCYKTVVPCGLIFVCIPETAMMRITTSF